MIDSPIQRAADAFAAELARWRIARGMTKKRLAGRMNFDPSYISHVEARRHRPTADFARRAEAVLDTGGAIWRRFQEYDRLRATRPEPRSRNMPSPAHWLPPGDGLVVEHEDATLRFADDTYRIVVRRALYNAGSTPVTRYPVRIAVDRYPHDPTRSSRHHRSFPLTFTELRLRAHHGEPPEPMMWRVKQDRDVVKEVWLLFENDDGRFPLYPGERVVIEYAYQVGQEKWGPWFQRTVRLPTRQLTVRLDLPADLRPQVWGVETSLSAEEAPLRLSRRGVGERLIFEWSAAHPSLNARYRLEWRFKKDRRPSAAAGPHPGLHLRASVATAQRSG